MNSLEPVVANDTAPKRIVQVEHKTLSGLAFGSTEHTANVIRVNGHDLQCHRHFGAVPAARIMPSAETDFRSREGHIDKQVSAFKLLFNKPAVELLDHGAPRARY